MWLLGGSASVAAPAPCAPDATVATRVGAVLVARCAPPTPKRTQLAACIALRHAAVHLGGSGGGGGGDGGSNGGISLDGSRQISAHQPISGGGGGGSKSSMDTSHVQIAAATMQRLPSTCSALAAGPALMATVAEGSRP